MSGLKELQQEWRKEDLSSDVESVRFLKDVLKNCAADLQPHIEHMEALESRHRALVEAARESIKTGSWYPLTQALQEDNK